MGIAVRGAAIARLMTAIARTPLGEFAVLARPRTLLLASQIELIVEQGSTPRSTRTRKTALAALVECGALFG